MVFRTKRQHLECAICQRHRLLLRSFANHLVARQQQSLHYDAHLRSQYRDRLQYWSVRGESRIHSTTICCILDGMDMAKFAYPRAPVMGGKQWANFARPRTHVCGLKIHGYGMFFSISRHDVPKDSNHHVELLAHGLTRVQKHFGLDFSKYHLHIQSDNCVRETKNNSVARWCSLLVARGWVFADLLTRFDMPFRCNATCTLSNRARNFRLHGYGLSEDRP